jgi:prepilin-type N-terminal cleavage/methylation domain-containing protein
MRTRNDSGFTVIEIIITLAILSILSGLTVVKYTKMVASTALENSAWNVLKDLSGIRPMVMKYDQQGIVKFKNRSYIINKITKTDTLKLPADIGFGIPSGGPTVDPFSIAIVVDSGGKGNWKDSLVVKKDAIGTLNTGYVIVSSSKVTKLAYYVGVSGSLQTIVIYKWTGGLPWVKL